MTRKTLPNISISLILAAAAENISTISSNANGGCNVSVSPNNTTVGISPCGAVPKSIEIEVDVKLKPPKKKARFQNSLSAESADANHENPPQNGEKEALSNKNAYPGVIAGTPAFILLAKKSPFEKEFLNKYMLA